MSNAKQPPPFIPYKCIQDIRHPMGCIDKGVQSVLYEHAGNYHYFPYNGKENEPVTLGNGMLIDFDAIDDFYSDWFEKI